MTKRHFAEAVTGVHWLAGVPESLIPPALLELPAAEARASASAGQHARVDARISTLEVTLRAGLAAFDRDPLDYLGVASDLVAARLILAELPPIPPVDRTCEAIFAHRLRDSFPKSGYLLARPPLIAAELHHYRTWHSHVRDIATTPGAKLAGRVQTSVLSAPVPTSAERGALVELEALSARGVALHDAIAALGAPLTDADGIEDRVKAFRRLVLSGDWPTWLRRSEDLRQLIGKLDVARSESGIAHRCVDPMYGAVMPAALDEVHLAATAWTLADVPVPVRATVSPSRGSMTGALVGATHAGLGASR